MDDFTVGRPGAKARPPEVNFVDVALVSVV
jgi:hypothetical protein